ncbi:MAG: DNA repair protein RadC, partial [Candidatus Magnetoglobus multicellularis str. Araruama]
MTNQTTADYQIGHRKRLRERFLKAGLDGFHDYEIVELLLTIGTPRKDVRPMAREAIDKFKTLSGVLNASVEELTQIKGIGNVSIFGIRLVKAVAERYTQETIVNERSLVNSPESLRQYLQHTLGHRNRECFAAILLDAKNKVIQTEIIFEGSLTSTCVYTREVIAAILKHNAVSVMFAHNHPSGDPTPSQEDIDLTRNLVQACQVIDVIVHEHMI